MSDSDEPPAPARPTTPRLSARPSGSSRPARPRRQVATETVVEEPPAPPEPVIAETVVVVPPPPEPAPPAAPRPMVFGTPFLRQTLFPPTAVLAAGCFVLGITYFLLPGDAALRQISPTVPVLMLILALACGCVAFALARSLCRIDSMRGNS